MPPPFSPGQLLRICPQPSEKDGQITAFAIASFMKTHEGQTYTFYILVLFSLVIAILSNV